MNRSRGRPPDVTTPSTNQEGGPYQLQSEDTSHSLAQQAYRKIKEQILNCNLRPGEKLGASELARTYNMSRTPVHEALKLLCKEGLVQVIPRVGYVISPITLSDVQEIFQLRLHLEGLSAELAAKAIKKHDLDRFKQMTEQVRAAASETAAGSPEFLTGSIDANRRFHMMVAELSGNRRLIEMIERLLDESERILALEPFTRQQFEFMGPGHSRVMDALAAKDESAAREEMANHVREVHERIVRSLLEATTPV